MFKALTGHCAVPNYTDLRPARQAKNLTLTAAAEACKTWPARLSEIELGKKRNDDLADRYREWIQAA